MYSLLYYIQDFDIHNLHLQLVSKVDHLFKFNGINIEEELETTN